MMEVYVVCRRVDDRNLIAGVYRDRADAVEEAEETIQKISHGECDSYTVNSVNNNSMINVFTGGDWRCIVYPFTLQ